MYERIALELCNCNIKQCSLAIDSCLDLTGGLFAFCRTVIPDTENSTTGDGENGI